MTASPLPSPTAFGRTSLTKDFVLDKRDEEHHMNLEQMIEVNILSKKGNHSDDDSQRIASTTHEKAKLYINISEALNNSVEEARRLPSIKLRDNGEDHLKVMVKLARLDFVC
nr:uncharacterized protein LOC109178709 [Ipomoea batatas]